MFGKKYDITKTDYHGCLDQLLTLEEPSSKIPLFDEVLEWCINVNEELKDSNRQIKLMLDIKTDNDAIQLYDLIWKGFENFNGVDYWKDKVFFGLWKSDFYIPEKLYDFKVINITFDIYAAERFYNELKLIDPEAKLHAVSMINLILYRENDKTKMINWIKDRNIKLWFWTVNDYIELREVIKTTLLKSGESLLEGIVTDDPTGVFHEEETTIVTGWKYSIRRWFKTSIYALFLFGFRRGYRLKMLFVGLKSIGFI